MLIEIDDLSAQVCANGWSYGDSLDAALQAAVEATGDYVVDAGP